MKRLYQLPLFASLLMIGSLFLLPIVTISENRIQAGEGISFFILAPEISGVMLIVSICFIMSTVLEIPKGYLLQSITWLILVFVLFQSISNELHMLSIEGSSQRLSFTSGFWVFLLGSYLYFQVIPWPKQRWRITTVLVLILGLITIVVLANFSQLGLYQEYQLKVATYWKAVQQHVMLALSATVFVVGIGISLGFWIYRRPQVEGAIMMVINILQVIPTIALLGILMIPLTFISKSWPFLAELGIKGVGWFPAFIALICYGLLPMVVNTVAGLRNVDADVLEAAKGIGMTKRQIFKQVNLPLAAPVILAGIRISVTQAMGNTILAGLIGGGGLGNFIFLGLAQSAPELILLGALSVVVLTLFVNFILEWGKFSYDYARRRYQKI
ncbi:MAG: ABC transporter permease [Culicoidibacterales bacterium]